MLVSREIPVLKTELCSFAQSVYPCQCYARVYIVSCLKVHRTQNKCVAVNIRIELLHFVRFCTNGWFEGLNSSGNRMGEWVGMFYIKEWKRGLGGWVFGCGCELVGIMVLRVSQYEGFFVGEGEPGVCGAPRPHAVMWAGQEPRIGRLKRRSSSQRGSFESLVRASLQK